MNGVPEQTPFEHRSLLVHAILSVHGKALLFVQACLLALLQSCWIVIYLDVKLVFENNILNSTSVMLSSAIAFPPNCCLLFSAMLRKVSLPLLAAKISRFSPLLFTTSYTVSSYLSSSLLYSNLFRRISFHYLLSSHLTLIAGIHVTIWVALIADFTLPQVTVVSDFGVAGMTAACETTVRVCTCVLAWAAQTLVHICNKEKQVLWKCMDGTFFHYGSAKKG